ncbi:CvpA family protein [Peptococcaceae bacterium]|nr:CvpA family protein [Peptococcaceae bacterium]
MNWCDFIIASIIIYFAINGFVTGFILSITKLIALITAFIVSIKYSSALTDYIVVYWKLDEKMMSLFNTLLCFFIPEDFSEKIYIQQSSILNDFKNLLPQFSNIIDEINKTALNTVDEVHHQVINTVSYVLAHSLIVAMSFLAILIATYLTIKFIGKILDKLIGGTVLLPFNRIAGMVFGVIRGFLIIVIATALLIPLRFFGLDAEKGSILSDINESYFINLVFEILTKLEWSIWNLLSLQKTLFA